MNISLEIGTVLHGFLIKSQRPVSELKATLWEMEHEKSGARLVWLDRQEDNKTFGIAFQTQPWDDTGVFHILEHSVLCGSDRYPVKEPFVELMKSSMNTFLNAMTFPDKTFYPVSSRNEQDFMNLLRVYMDAVLHPSIHRKPEIFSQEGWHYELDQEGRPSYKGVVFNEMKGVFASPDSLLEREMNRSLFPDNCYRFVSGGDPEHIPELTYEQFVSAHKRLYHPSNAYIFLDGHIDIEQVLTALDEEYLSAYDRTPTPDPIPCQQPVDGGTTFVDYELSPQEDTAGRVWIADGFAACTFRDREDMVAIQALSDALCGDNQAPLKRRLLENGLARDVRLSLHDGIQQPWVSLEARDIRKDQIEEVSAALQAELEQLVTEGLDHQRLLANLDNLEFQMRQRDYGGTPQGLMFGIQVLESWLYGGDPEANLNVGKLFDDLREKCEAGHFEKLLERIVLKNPHRCRVIMRPSHTAGQERQERETARLHDAWKSWDEQSIANLRTQQEKLEAWQSTPDSPSDLAKLPMLRLDQISAEPEYIPISTENRCGLSVLRHELPTGGVTYLNLYFALDDLTQEQLAQASFICDLLGSLHTASYELAELKQKLRSLFGGVQFTVESYGQANQPEKCRTFLCAYGSTLDTKIEKAVKLLVELLKNTSFDDTGKIFDLLRQRRTAMTQWAAMNGHSFAMGRVSACVTAAGAAQEYAGGVTYLAWLKDLELNFQQRQESLSETLAGLAAQIFVRDRLTLSVTTAEKMPVEVTARILGEFLPQGGFHLPDVPAIQPLGYRREGIVLPVDVSFAATGGLFPDSSNGTAKVMSRIASLAYLWNTVRVQGGAYGAGMRLRDNGVAEFYSYRDPNAARTLDCYRQTSDFLESIKDTDVTGFIIGAVAESEPLLTPRAKGKTADSLYWKGISYEDLCRTRREMLATVPQSVMELADTLRCSLADGPVCVLGSQKQVDACGLDSVITL